MTTVEQPTSFLTPSSDADEGLPLPGVSSGTPRQPSVEIGQIKLGESDGVPESSTASAFEKKGTNLLQGEELVRDHNLYKELAPLVAMPPPSDAVAHSRLAKQSYSRLGRNLLFEARPAVRLCPTKPIGTSSWVMKVEIEPCVSAPPSASSQHAPLRGDSPSPPTT